MKTPLTLFRRRPRSEAEVRREEAARPSVHERARKVTVDDPTRRLYQAVSLLLDYPTPELLERLPLLEETVEECVRQGARSAARLRPLLTHLRETDLTSAQQAYVETFDLRRRCCLHLTYYGYGDTRRRGMALLDVKQAYQASGVDLADVELPDHLCVVLEFAATVDPPVGRVLLGDHRPGIELLRLSLTDRGSVYAGAIEAVTGTFPTLLGHESDVVRALIASGPPDEEVGLEAYTSDSHPSIPRSTLSEVR